MIEYSSLKMSSSSHHSCSKCPIYRAERDALQSRYREVRSLLEEEQSRSERLMLRIKDLNSELSETERKRRRERENEENEETVIVFGKRYCLKDLDPTKIRYLIREPGGKDRDYRWCRHDGHCSYGSLCSFAHHKGNIVPIVPVTEVRRDFPIPEERKTQQTFSNLRHPSPYGELIPQEFPNNTRLSPPREERRIAHPAQQGNIVHSVPQGFLSNTRLSPPREERRIAHPAQQGNIVHSVPQGFLSNTRLSPPREERKDIPPIPQEFLNSTLSSIPNEERNIVHSVPQEPSNDASLHHVEPISPQEINVCGQQDITEQVTTFARL